MSQVILVVGASGRTGIELIRAANASDEHPQVHAFLRDPDKLPPSESSMCTSVIQGDATVEADVERALDNSGAHFVVVAIGRSDVGPTDVREKSAKALMEVVRHGGDYAHVRIVCVSSIGAGGTSIRLRFGMGAVLTYFLRHVLKDHDKQEEVLQDSCYYREDESERKKLLILRPTGLTTGKPSGAVTLFGDGKAPSGRIDRKDLAEWIVAEICGSGEHFGSAVNITGS